MQKCMTIMGLCLLCLILLGNQASALPLRIEDTYIGGDDHQYGDVISADGEENLFDVDWMDVEIIDTMMTVNVHTDFGIGETYGLDYGDLFLSIDGWNPNGDSPYMDDDASTGESWEYAFDVSSGKLYDIRSAEGQAAIQNSDDVLSGGTFRNGQEVLLDTTDRDDYVVSQGGSAGRNGEYYSMQFDMTGMDMDFDNFVLGTHWTMTCGNDVIEGEFDPGTISAIPEPSTLLLFGSGLLGAVAWERKRRKKSSQMRPIE